VTEQIVDYYQAKKITREFGITTSTQYKALMKAGKLPKGLPKYPQTFYLQKNKKFATYDFVTFKQAKKIIGNKQFRTITEYQSYVRELKKSGINLPLIPQKAYAKDGFDLDSFFNRETRYGDKIISFKQARKLMKENGITGRTDYAIFRKKCKLKLPTEPNHYPKWKKEWNGWGDFTVDLFVIFW